MSYSRSRSREIRRKRRSRRLRFLLGLNLFLIVLIAAAVAIVLLDGRDAGDEPAAGPFPPGTASASAAASGSPAATGADGAGDEKGNGTGSEKGTGTGGEKGSGAGEASGGGTGDGAEDGAEEGAGDDSDKITLAFVGDILPAGSVARLMRQKGYDYPFLKTKDLITSADIAAGNLEAAITDRGTPAENKQYLFRGPVEALQAVRDAGFDVLNLANNHTLDYGWVGLQDTMDALDDLKLHHMGAGADDKEAFAPVYVEANGITVGFIGVTNVVPEVSWKAGPKNAGLAELYDPARAIAAVEETSRHADLVVVMVHWGLEGKDMPESYQTVKGRKLIDAGADLVIGSHPHVLQGFEVYKDKWIAYSLGNFVFNTTASPKTAETGILVAECGKDGACSLKLHPMKSVNSQPAPMEEAAGQALLSRLSAISASVELEESGNLVAKR